MSHCRGFQCMSHGAGVNNKNMCLFLNNCTTYSNVLIIESKHVPNFGMNFLLSKTTLLLISQNIIIVAPLRDEFHRCYIGIVFNFSRDVQACIYCLGRIQEMHCMCATLIAIPYRIYSKFVVSYQALHCVLYAAQNQPLI